MNISPTPLRGTLVGMLAFAAVTIGSPLVAQTKSGSVERTAKGQLLEISVVIIKPDKIAEYERLQKEEVGPALQKAGLAARYFFKGGRLNDGYLYGVAVPIGNLASLDERPLEKALGKAAAHALIDRVNACHVSKRVFTTRQVPDLCWGQTFSPVAVVVEHRLTPGRKTEWLKFMREHLIPVVRKSDILGFVVEEMVLGGTDDVVFTLGFWRNYADLDKGPAARHVLGEEGYEMLMQKLPSGVVLQRDARVIEFLADLSFGPALKPGQAKMTGDPWIGTWQLNLARTRINPGPAPRSETRSYAAAADGEKAIYDLVEASGKRLYSESTYKFDGRHVPLVGNPDGETQAIRRAGPRSITGETKKGRNVIRTATRTVSEDGKMLTVEFKGTNRQGQPIIEEVWVFDRVAAP